LAAKVTYDSVESLDQLDYEFLVRANFYLDSVQNPDFVIPKKRQFVEIQQIIINMVIKAWTDEQDLGIKFAITIKPRWLIDQKLLPDACEYFGNFIHVCDSRPFLNRVNFEPTKVRHRSRIGVGYRDKGHKRNLALDGSPHWQEITHHSDYFRTLPDKFYDLEYVNKLYNFGVLPNEFGLTHPELIDLILEDSD
jgi:hypothetical protein